MDDDLYNAVDVADDVSSQRSPLRYDDGNTEAIVLNEISRTSRRPAKRPLNIDNCEAIDWHMRIPCAFEEIEGKRQKKEREEFLLSRLTQRILEARRQVLSSVELDKESTSNKDLNQEKKYALEMPPVDGTPWITMNSPDCTRRFYIRLKKQSVVESFNGVERTFVPHMPCTAVLKARELQSNDAICTQLMDTFPLNHLNGSYGKLWVDKYAPHNFADLASDDRINRLLLNWIKLWDECVFKKRFPDTYGISEEMLAVDEGPPKRPHYKVVLIAGPAGIGKTTLATIIARHAGYAVSEVNASDDRNVADFEKRIDSAVKTINTLDQEKRPICLLLDEIDGAPSDSIRLLCKIVTRTGKKSIRRPIICICNNLYCPSLRDLRSIALVLQMPHSDSERLSKRLREISIMEGVRVDNVALNTLVSSCGFDLRSSINSLQYLAMRFSNSTIDSDVVLKHVSTNWQFTERTLFDSWSCILEQKSHLDQRGRLRSSAERAQRISSVVGRVFDDSSRLFTGLFANYPNSSIGSGGIGKLKKVADQFCDYDLLMSFINHSSNYAFTKYTFIFAVAIHFLISSPSRIQLVYPTVEQNCAQRKRQTSDTLQWLKTQEIFASISNAVLTLDFLPLFTIITQPPIKQANLHLLNERERNLFQCIVTTMQFYSIKFKSLCQDGVTSSSFFPPIDQIVLFPLDESDEGYNRPTPLPYGTRQTIAHQVELSMLRNEIPESTADGVSPATVSPAHVETPSAGEITRQLVYRYNKGFSNAIRRNIKMRNLIFDN